MMEEQSPLNPFEEGPERIPQTVSDQLSLLLQQRHEIEQAIEKYRRLWAVLFVDLCGSSRLFSERGDLSSLLIVNRFKENVLSSFQSFHPKYVELSGGDQILAAFENSVVAAEAIIATLRKLDLYNQSANEAERIHISAGLHLGKVFYQNEKLEHQCNTLNIAKRLQDLAGTNQIFISKDVSTELFRQNKYYVTSLGRKSLKNIKDPQALYELHWREGDESGYTGEVLQTSTIENQPEKPNHHETIVQTYKKNSVSNPFVDESPPSEGISCSRMESFCFSDHTPENKKIYVSQEGNPNHFSSINEAIQFAPMNYEIYVKSGIYRENVRINRSHITLISEPVGMVRIEPESGPPFEIQNAENVKIVGFLVEGPRNTESTPCFRIESSRSVKVEQCSIVRSNDDGIYVHTSKEVQIKHTNVKNAYTAGIHIGGVSSAVIDSCNVTDNGRIQHEIPMKVGYGICIKDHSDVTIQYSTIGGNVGPGIATRGTDGVKVLRNKIQGNGVVSLSPGVFFSQCAGGELSKNQIIENGGAGIRLLEAKVNVVGNKILRNGNLTKPPLGGIVCVDSAKSKVKRNTLVGNGDDSVKYYRQRPQSITKEFFEEPYNEEEMIENESPEEKPIGPSKMAWISMAARKHNRPVFSVNPKNKRDKK